MYRLTQFAGVNLSGNNQVDTIGSGVTPIDYLDLPDGGALDGYGAVAKMPGATERHKKYRLQASTLPLLESAFYGLMALRGQRGKLVRTTTQGAQHWMFARLAEITADRDYQLTQFGLIQDIDLRFICQEAAWRGTAAGGWLLDSAQVLDGGLSLDSGSKTNLVSSPTSFTATVTTGAGAAPIRSIAIEISVGNAALTGFTLSRAGGESISFNGVVPAGGQLVIYTGTMQVTATGLVDPYGCLALPSNANLGAWFTLLPGTNNLTATFTGGGSGSTLQLSYQEAWY